MWVNLEPAVHPIKLASNPAEAPQTHPETALPVPAEKAPQADKPLSPPRIPALRETPSDAIHSRKRPFRATSRDCLLLAAAYLWGTFCAGILQARCNAPEAEMLAYYLQCWQSLFSIPDAARVAWLFAAELTTTLGALTVFLLLGLSALGAVPIYLFAMVYGTGVGLLSAQLLAGLEWKRLLWVGTLVGLPTALAAGVLCLFGASALRVSSRLHALSFAAGKCGRGGIPGAKLLLGQYLLACGAFLPLCGGATCLAYLAAQLG